MPSNSRSTWSRALLAYLDRRMFVILLLGFSAGLPFALSFTTLSVWFRETGVSRSEIGIFSLVSLPYALKFLWAPLIDRVRVPFLTALVGQRRSWALVAQAGLMIALAWLGSLDPATDLRLMAVAAIVVVFMAASQDIVIDAFRIEILKRDEQAIGGAVYQYGYRFGMLASGAGALYLSDHLPWSTVYAIEAGLVLVGVATILGSREPDSAADSGTAAHGPLGWIRSTLVEPFADLRRPLWPVLLIFIALYRFPDSALSVMANVFYKDVGLTNTEIASISKVFGTAATIFGVFVGGLVVHRYGALKGLFVCGLVQAASNLMYVVMAQVAESGASASLIPVFAATIAAENVSGGMGGAAFVGYLSSLCSPGFAGTQYALLSAVGVTALRPLSALGGVLADEAGWTVFFLTTTAVGVPGLLILLWFMQRPDSWMSVPVARSSG